MDPLTIATVIALGLVALGGAAAVGHHLGASKSPGASRLASIESTFAGALEHPIATAEQAVHGIETMALNAKTDMALKLLQSITDETDLDAKDAANQAERAARRAAAAKLAGAIRPAAS